MDGTFTSFTGLAGDSERRVLLKHPRLEARSLHDQAMILTQVDLIYRLTGRPDETYRINYLSKTDANCQHEEAAISLTPGG